MPNLFDRGYYWCRKGNHWILQETAREGESGAKLCEVKGHGRVRTRPWNKRWTGERQA